MLHEGKTLYKLGMQERACGWAVAEGFHWAVLHIVYSQFKVLQRENLIILHAQKSTNVYAPQVEVKKVLTKVGPQITIYRSSFHPVGNDPSSVKKKYRL